VLIMIVWILSEVSRKLSRLYIDTTNELPNIEKLLELFENTGSIEWFDSWSKFTFKKWNIKLDSLSFSYTNNSWDVLSNLTIDIEWWKKTALVGPSWSWKTTLVKLITWYIRPDSGSIIVDWQDLTQVSLKSYYKHIWYLTQEPSVFDGTIRENLLYAVESDSLTTNEWISQAPCPMDIPLLKGEEKGVCNGRSLDDRLTQAIKSSQCEFIYDLPNWLDTEIGERGVRLSGWQRQRLAIAKIFLKNPEIIILDEPTSALDSFSEEAITVAMNELFKDRTVVIIAHRLQTVKHADDIILLDQGEVLERGTHAELVNQWGQYAKMLELQSGF
jgi:ABC-type multidrug transport system fused ATPase/permease subunit